MDERDIPGGQRDRDSGGHQGTLEWTERDVLGGGQISAGVAGMRVSERVGIRLTQVLDQYLGGFRLDIAFIDRHQAAHSLHTGWPSSSV